MKNRKPIQILLFILVISWPIAALAWSGKVTHVSSGDSITVHSQERTLDIRLFGVDAPELEQSFGTRARGFAASLVAGKDVTVEEIPPHGKGPIIAIIKLNGESLNGELVRSGYGWIYPESCDQPVCADWQLSENDARAAGKGLWQDENPVPPWEWRKKDPKNVIAKFLRLFYTVFSLRAPPQ